MNHKSQQEKDQNSIEEVLDFVRLLQENPATNELTMAQKMAFAIEVQRNQILATGVRVLRHGLLGE